MPFVWLIPSFYGDIKLDWTGEKSCLLHAEKLSAQETTVLTALQKTALEKGWLKEPVKSLLGPGPTPLDAPIQKVASVLARALKPGRKFVSAVCVRSGSIQEVTDRTFTEILPLHAEKTDKEPAKAVTVAAPARGCPVPEFNVYELKARAVLMSFLTDEQRADFLKHNAFVSVGAETGHRYMLSSRHAPGYTKYGRSLYDLDEEQPICTHDFSVPAAEELLALHVFVSLPGWESYVRELPG